MKSDFKEIHKNYDTMLLFTSFLGNSYFYGMHNSLVILNE